MNTVLKVKENCGDILADAHDINENKALEENKEVVESE